MNHQQQFQFRQQLEQYIIKSNVNNILESLLEDIIIKKPQNPIDYIINKLQEPERQINFVIGPPGLRTFSYLERVRQQKTSHTYDVFNCGQYVTKIAKDLSEQSQNQLKQGLLIHKNQTNQKILKQVAQLFKSSKNSIIIEGYPKNLEQAVALQRAHIPPTKIILMNVSEQHLNQICARKIKSIQQNLQGEQLQQKVNKMVMEYRLSMKELKQFYNNFSEIDLTKGNNSEEHILQQLRRAFDIKTVSLTPRTCSHVLVIGAPHSGRTTLAKSFAKFYNLVYISTRSLISNQIRRDSIAGRKIKDSFLKNQLIDQFTIQKLIQERISQTDCLMQGFVLEGYPKTEEQYQNMKNLNIRPTLTISIDMPQEQSLKRGGQGQQSSKKRYQKWADFRQFLKNRPQKMFWVDYHLNSENMFEQVKYEFEKRH